MDNEETLVYWGVLRREGGKTFCLINWKFFAKGLLMTVSDWGLYCCSHPSGRQGRHVDIVDDRQALDPCGYC